ncbi:MAG TPA: DUF2330 domain-containing protein [Frankiaceae bacterium]|nr:DUF2330 domain-containing protein [Frankiaceae bacterium]
MRRVLATVAATVASTVGVAAPAIACGGLIGPNGAVNLLRTTTFAGYHDGVEHYVTSFAFAGGGGAFGSLTPLPGVPTKVERGGDWTLQRLIRETEVLAVAERGRDDGAAVALSAKAEVLMTAKVDALDITILKGGGDEVGRWAKEHGFRLPPDAPEVLDFYAKRSPIFMAAAFDADAARERGQQVGDGTPVHLTIPTENPWVPLRILGLGKQANEPVQADVYLLTDRRPRLLSTAPIGRGKTLSLAYDKRANDQLLTDLRTDKSGDWVPRSGWLTKVTVDGPAADLTGDLAIDARGEREPSMVAAGFDVPLAAGTPARPADEPVLPVVIVAVAALLVFGAITVTSLRGRRTA